MIQNGKINILMVMANTRMGGVQAFVLNILRNIDHAKYHIDFAINFFAEDKGIEDVCRQYGCDFHILPYFKVFNYPQYCKSWRSFLSSHPYDIVYAHATNSASIFLKIAKKLGIKTIAHSHSAGYRGNLIEQMTKKFFARGVGKVADYWFACSDKAAIRLFGDNYRSYPNYYLIPNAIDVGKYRFNQLVRDKIREQIGVTANTFLCGHLGTFSAVKNHKFLIDIFAEVVKTKSDAKLVCCGAGALMQSIKDQAKNLGLSNKVIFSGVVENANEYMMAMDCFIFPSFFEGFPVSVLEAQATGLPVVMNEVITKEVDLTQLIHRLPLTESAQTWAKEVSKVQVDERTEYNEHISESYYNIKSAIAQFETLISTLANK